MPSLTTLGLFVAATVVLIAIPGPSTFYILSRGLAGGRRVALVSALGVETGSALFVVLTAAGLSALLATTQLALTVLHYLGAGYLFFLAWQALRRSGARSVREVAGRASAWATYHQGLLRRRL